MLLRAGSRLRVGRSLAQKLPDGERQEDGRRDQGRGDHGQRRTGHEHEEGQPGGRGRETETQRREQVRVGRALVPGGRAVPMAPFRPPPLETTYPTTSPLSL